MDAPRTSWAMKTRLLLPWRCLDMTLSVAYSQILSGISTLGWKPAWDSLLSNGTANYPNGSYQTGIVYGDYYYIKVRQSSIRCYMCISNGNASSLINQNPLTCSRLAFCQAGNDLIANGFVDCSRLNTK